MNKIEFQFFNVLQSHCCQILLIPPSRFIGFGGEDTDDMIVHGSIKSTFKNVSEMTEDGQIDAFDLDPDVISFIDGCQNSDCVSLFSLTDNRIKAIKLAIKALDATHIRFHHKSGSVWVNIFDYRCFLYDSRIRREHPFQVGTLDLLKRSDTEFSFTMNAESFKSLREQDYSIRIGDNGYAEFSSAEPNTFNFSYLAKGQDVIEPVVTFFNAQHSLDIAFLPVPNLIPVDPHTTPRTDQ